MLRFLRRSETGATSHKLRKTVDFPSHTRALAHLLFVLRHSLFLVAGRARALARTWPSSGWHGLTASACTEHLVVFANCRPAERLALPPRYIGGATLWSRTGARTSLLRGSCSLASAAAHHEPAAAGSRSALGGSAAQPAIVSASSTP